MLVIAIGLGAWSAWTSQHAQVKIEWTTASELNTAGFNVYRSDSPEGSAVRINQELIPASTDPLAGGMYQFIDKNAQPGRTYYYALEDVETNGVTNRSWHTSVDVARQGFLEGGAAFLLAAVALTGIYLTNRRSQQIHA